VRSRSCSGLGFIWFGVESRHPHSAKSQRGEFRRNSTARRSPRLIDLGGDPGNSIAVELALGHGSTKIFDGSSACGVPKFAGGYQQGWASAHSESVGRGNQGQCGPVIWSDKTKAVVRAGLHG
jgi:hypothetical protein